MKELLRTLFLPILRIFESDEDAYHYKKSHRTVLLVVGGLFLVLSTAVAAVVITTAQLGGLFPCLLFFLLGLVCLVVGLLGNDRAVAKMWGSK
jgi:hypothetical protein